MNNLRNGLYGTALVLAAAALGGCGQVANVRSQSTGYVPPQGGETARIRLLTDGLSGVDYRV